MKLLTKNADYAIRAMLELARGKGSFLSARDISKGQGIPYQFLRRILHELIRHKLVISREGSRGGFKINKDPASVDIVEIIRIFQGDIQLTECMFRRQLCANRASCALRKEIKKVEGIVEKEFRGVTIAKLLRQAK